MDDEEERVPPDITLQLSDKSATGYRGVKNVQGRYAASCWVQGSTCRSGPSTRRFRRRWRMRDTPRRSRCVALSEVELPPNHEPPVMHKRYATATKRL